MSFKFLLLLLHHHFTVHYKCFDSSVEDYFTLKSSTLFDLQFECCAYDDDDDDRWSLTWDNSLKKIQVT